MSCVLRIYGSDLVVDDLLCATNMIPYRIDRKGESRASEATQSVQIHKLSAIHIDVSSAEFSDLPTQINDALAFLEKCGDQLRIALHVYGVEGAVLDFAIECRDVVVQYNRFPAALLKKAGELEIDLEISHYLVP